MFSCEHSLGQWLDRLSQKERFPNTFATFSPEAERKYHSYWNQIASYFAGKQRLIFEGST